MIQLSELKLNDKNPRLIKDDKFKKLVKSIRDFPQMMELRPIIVDENNIIQGGNMRFRALIDLKYKEVPDAWVKQGKELTPEQWREFVIKDNVGFGEWDFETLANEWNAEELLEWGVDLPIDFGGKTEAHEDDYDMPDEVQTDIVRGDLFEIGQHRLLCGDSIQIEEVLKLMGGQKADMVFTDPPYNIDYGNIKRPKFKVRHIENDNMSKDDFKNFSDSFAESIKQFNKGCTYVCGPPGPDGRIMFVSLDEKLHCSTVIIWNKDQFTLGSGKYQNKYEPIWFGWNNDGTTFYADRTQTNVWDIPRPKKSEDHPTMKPVELVAKSIIHASRNDDCILDLFIGSGTTMVAAHQLNRKCYGMEIDPKYCQVIIDRMLKLDPTLTITKNGQLYERTQANS